MGRGCHDPTRIRGMFIMHNFPNPHNYWGFTVEAPSDKLRRGDHPPSESKIKFYIKLRTDLLSHHPKIV